MPQEKDAAERQLESYNDVFADIFNVLLFDGRRVISEGALQDAQPVSQFKADGELHQEERDCAKYWMDGLLRIGVLGLENQTAIEEEEPLRVISYDGGNYKSQVLRRREERRNGKPLSRLYPVVTLVLNFSEKRWTGKASLRECLDIPEELSPFVEDYHIHVFDIAFLSEDTVAKFQSDFGILADYLVQKRTKQDFKPTQQLIGHVDALFKMMEAASGVHGFMERLEEQRKLGKGEPKMLTGFLLENKLRDEARGRAEGRIEGRIEGRAEGRAEGRVEGRAVMQAQAVQALMRKMGLLEAEAMDVLEIPEEEREACQKYLEKLDAG